MSTDRATTAVTEADLNALRHMLGVGSHIPRRQWGYRNYYWSAERDVPAMERLCAAGYAEFSHTMDSARIYHATRAGAEAIGLPVSAMRRANLIPKS